MHYVPESKLGCKGRRGGYNEGIATVETLYMAAWKTKARRSIKQTSKELSNLNSKAYLTEYRDKRQDHNHGGERGREDNESKGPLHPPPSLNFHLS